MLNVLSEWGASWDDLLCAQELWVADRNEFPLQGLRLRGGRRSSKLRLLLLHVENSRLSCFSVWSGASFIKLCLGKITTGGVRKKQEMRVHKNFLIYNRVRMHILRLFSFINPNFCLGGSVRLLEMRPQDRLEVLWAVLGDEWGKWTGHSRGWDRL